VRAPQFHRHWWRPYHLVNQRFAEIAAATLGPDDVAWVQDYQLQLVPQMIRDQAPVHRIGFYLHIPFPPVELFAKLPWRRQVLEGLLGSDVLAFQSRSSRINFAVAARRLAGATGSSTKLTWRGRTVVLQVAPIGIDTSVFDELAMSDDTAALADEIREQLGDPEVVILGVDRLDYTKGIDLRMRALQTLLERRQDLRGKVVFVQVAVPSREDVAEYQKIRADIERLVGRINGDLAEVGRPPIHYLYRSVSIDELVAYYRAADVMFVTPLRDGMNLVCKEYVATRFDDTGALILSEFAGAAEELEEAFLVNPYDLDALASTLEQAIETAPVRGNPRMKALRRSVGGHDVYWWARRCLRALDV
jgi:trehalose 6-phosphate synthase